jgi:UDP-glucose 4-epimerase
MKRVLITGSSGYFGCKLVEYLAEKPHIEELVGVDVSPPAKRNDKLAFYQRDVRSLSDDIMKSHSVDTVIHAAWVLPPIHDKAKMEDININGTKAVLESVLKAGVGQLLYTSSTTAYGFHPDNDNPLTESSPLRGNDDFTYSKCKRLVDKLVQDFAQEHQHVAVTIVRPCFVVGPGFNNPLANHLRKRIVLMPSPRSPLQFVHEDDLVEAMYQLLILRKAGIYNIAGDGVISADEMVKILGNVPFPLPFKVLWVVNNLGWYLRLRFLTEFPSPALNLLRYRWVASNDKLKKEIGFKYRCDSRAAFEDFARHVRENTDR